MAINRERLEARREELRAQAEQLRLNLAAVSGAIQDLDFLINEDEKTSEDVETA